MVQGLLPHPHPHHVPATDRAHIAPVVGVKADPSLSAAERARRRSRCQPSSASWPRERHGKRPGGRRARHRGDRGGPRSRRWRPPGPPRPGTALVARVRHLTTTWVAEDRRKGRSTGGERPARRSSCAAMESLAPSARGPAVSGFTVGARAAPNPMGGSTAVAPSAANTSRVEDPGVGRTSRQGLATCDRTRTVTLRGTERALHDPGCRRGLDPPGSRHRREPRGRRGPRAGAPALGEEPGTVCRVRRAR